MLVDVSGDEGTEVGMSVERHISERWLAVRVLSIGLGQPRQPALRRRGSRG
jgi:hypothetical protein